MRGLNNVRFRFGLLLIAVLSLQGCTPDGGKQTKVASHAGVTSPVSSQVIAVDISEQGIMKLTGLPEKGITALAEAGSGTNASRPGVVLLGREFVRQHGIAPWGGKLPGQLYRQGGLQPIIAVVDGPAEQLVSRIPVMEWLPELRRTGSGLAAFQHRSEGRNGDSIVPFISSSAEGNVSSAAGVQVKAAVLRGGVPALFPDRKELELLACLDGQATVYEGRNVSCRTEWSSNGDMKTPKIKAAVTVTSAPGNPAGLNRKAAAADMSQGMQALLRSLQLQGADPLDAGRTVRSLYRGAWTGERWRSAFARAHIEVNVRIRS